MPAAALHHGGKHAANPSPEKGKPASQRVGLRDKACSGPASKELSPEPPQGSLQTPPRQRQELNCRRPGRRRAAAGLPASAPALSQLRSLPEHRKADAGLKSISAHTPPRGLMAEIGCSTSQDGRMLIQDAELLVRVFGLPAATTEQGLLFWHGAARSKQGAVGAPETFLH